jgi:hypothetical protein
MKFQIHSSFACRFEEQDFNIVSIKECLASPSSALLNEDNVNHAATAVLATITFQLRGRFQFIRQQSQQRRAPHVTV